MTKIRGFEIIAEYLEQNIHLPQRSTFKSAGYDIEAAETIEIPSHWQQLITYYLKEFKLLKVENKIDTNTLLKPTLVPTGIKAYMQEDEYLQIINRSSNPLKRFLILPNSVGIIDADYYNNAANEGHIYVQLVNYGLFNVTIQKGDRIAQGIFTKFLKVDQDQGGIAERQGGFGSSDQA